MSTATYEVKRSHSVLQHVKSYIILVTGIFSGSLAGMQHLLLNSDYPNDLLARLIKFAATGDNQYNPVNIAGIESGKLSANVHGQTAGSSLKVKLNDKAIVLYDDLVEAVLTTANYDDYVLLAWMSALLDKTGYSYDWLLKHTLTPIYEEVELKAGGTARVETGHTSVLHDPMPNEPDMTVLQYAKSLRLWEDHQPA